MTQLPKGGLVMGHDMAMINQYMGVAPSTLQVVYLSNKLYNLLPCDPCKVYLPHERLIM